MQMVFLPYDVPRDAAVKRERDIERIVCRELIHLGYLPIKMVDTAGYPDRVVLGPNGRHFFIEFKTITGRLSPKQYEIFDILLALGHQVFVVRDNTKGVIDDLVAASVSTRQS